MVFFGGVRLRQTRVASMLDPTPETRSGKKSITEFCNLLQTDYENFGVKHIYESFKERLIYQICALHHDDVVNA